MSTTPSPQGPSFDLARRDRRGRPDRRSCASEVGGDGPGWRHSSGMPEQDRPTTLRS